MNKKIEDYVNRISHHKTMPDCMHFPTPKLRFFNGILEQLFENGYGELFWAPVPTVIEDADQM